MTAPIVSQADAEIEKLMGLHPKGYDLSLDRIRRLLEVLALVVDLDVDLGEATTEA